MHCLSVQPRRWISLLQAIGGDLPDLNVCYGPIVTVQDGTNGLFGVDVLTFSYACLAQVAVYGPVRAMAYDHGFSGTR